jgi:Flp pilus assembly protein TadG
MRVHEMMRRGWETFKRLRREDRGTQLVELAIVAPLLLMLVGATAEFGRFFYTYSTLAKATRAGARYQISQVPGANWTQTKNLVVFGNTAGTGSPLVAGLTTANVQVTERRTGGALQTITVGISGYAYTPVFDLGKLTKNAALSLNVNVAPSSTMRQLVQ